MPTLRQDQNHTFHKINHNTWQWKLFLLYDGLMMAIILLNLLILAIDGLILSGFGHWLAQQLLLSSEHLIYIQYWHPLIAKIDFYFICFLLAELSTRWLIAIFARHHRRWWFFPFIHWYEVLAIIPQLRFLRLFRAGIIAYRLHELGYQIIPKGILLRTKFYYEVVMEELSDRIVLTIIRQVEKELDSSTTHHRLIHQLIDHHRQRFADVLAQTLQQSLAKSLAAQHTVISQNIGQIVHDAIDHTPELTQLLKLMPFVGSKIEHLIQAIGQRLGENITQGILQPLTADNAYPALANPLLTEIAKQTSQIPLDSEELDQLVESIVRESLNGIREQVKIKQWQQILDAQPPSKSDDGENPALG